MKPQEFTKRRKRLMDMMGHDCIAIVPTSPVSIRSRDVEYQYRPGSDFYYLTGFPEPEAVAVIDPDRSSTGFIMFCRPRDLEKEAWDGRREGPKGVYENYGADKAYPYEKMDSILPKLLEGKSRIYYNMGNDTSFDSRLLGWVQTLKQRARSGVHAPDEFVSLDYFLHDMRLYKSAEEIRIMKRAAKISAAAHKRAMQACHPGMFEYQIEAELIYEFMRSGVRAAAYPSIVGGGENSCTLHYTENRALLNDGDVLLIDAGAELEGYASDISRTFPVSGRFSPEQRTVYELVLRAQEAAINEIRPGRHWNDPHEAAVEVITYGLVELGILKGRIRTLLSERKYSTYYMHRTGHWLGMDVHDVGDYMIDGEWRMLEPKMVMTVEPGLYFRPGLTGIDKKWWGIGIRIEDDVLVTQKGCEVLSQDAPKQVDEIEALMASGS